MHFKERKFRGGIRIVGKKSLVYKWNEFEVTVSHLDDKETCRTRMWKKGQRFSST